jgi:hypothetical protein
VITFIRQMVALPITLTGFWFTQIGDVLSDVAYKIEGVPTPAEHEKEESHGTTHAA